MKNYISTIRHSGETTLGFVSISGAKNLNQINQFTKVGEITDEDLLYLSNQVKQAYGFDFGDYAFSSFKRRIERVMMLFKIPSLSALILKLKNDKDFFNIFLEEITVNTTEMFRDAEVWREIRDKVLPNLASYPTINIWHAGCSTGEEVLTMAILLQEAGLHHKAKVLATDINPVVIENAKRGLIPKRSLPLNERNYTEFGGKHTFNHYYREYSNEKVQFKQELVENVKFQRFDLVKDVSYLKFDLIFCRNVMIYFNRDLQDRTGKLFRNVLFSKGFLILGNKESLVWCSVANDFKVFSQEHKIYQLKT